MKKKIITLATIMIALVVILTILARYHVSSVVSGAPVKLDSADTAWVSIAAALVMLMTPALGFFYGGLVRQKNVVSTIMQCLIIFALSTGVWTIFGYTLAFGPSHGGLIGGLKYVFLHGVGAAPDEAYAPTIPGVAVLFLPAEICRHHAGADHRRLCGAHSFSLADGVYHPVDRGRVCAGSALGLGRRRLAAQSGCAGFRGRNGRARSRRGLRARISHGYRTQERKAATRRGRATFRLSFSGPPCYGSAGSASMPGARWQSTA